MRSGRKMEEGEKAEEALVAVRSTGEELCFGKLHRYKKNCAGATRTQQESPSSAPSPSHPDGRNP